MVQQRLQLHGRARRRTRARFPQTTPAPATGSRRRAAWLAVVVGHAASGAPHGTDFGGQHREQLGIRVTCRRATKVQAPEVLWNLPVPTRVTLVVVVDDHGTMKRPTRNSSAIDLPPPSTPGRRSLPPSRSVFAEMIGTNKRTVRRIRGQNLLLPCIARAEPPLVQPHVPAELGDRVAQPPGASASSRM